MGELWRDIEEDIDDELDARSATVDLDAGADTIDASVDLGSIRSLFRPPDVLMALSTLVCTLLIVHWLAPKIGALVLFLILLGLFCAWAGLIAGLDFVGGLLAGLLELSIYTGMSAAELIKRSRLALVVALLVLVWGVFWHTMLSPTVRNRDRVDRIVEAVETRLARDEDLQDDLAAWLDVAGTDPHGLAAFMRDGELRDVWRQPLVYRTGRDERYHLYSTGPNQFDDNGNRDDYGHVEPLTGLVDRAADDVVDRVRTIGDDRR